MLQNTEGVLFLLKISSKSKKNTKNNCPIKFGVLHLRRFRHKTVTSVTKAVTLHFAATQTDSEEIQDCFPKVVARITFIKLFFEWLRKQKSLLNFR